jgi:general stress protein YciG
MAGTKSGGLKAAERNKALHGDDFYARIGSKGGKNAYKINPETGKALKGFALNAERARAAGRLGGSISKRGKSNG